MGALSVTGSYFLACMFRLVMSIFCGWYETEAVVFRKDKRS